MMTPEPVTAHAAFAPVDGARSCWRLELPLPVDPGSDDAGTLRFGIVHSRRAGESPRYAELTMSAHDASCCTRFAACPRDAVGVHELDATGAPFTTSSSGAVLHAATTVRAATRCRCGCGSTCSPPSAAAAPPAPPFASIISAGASERDAAAAPRRGRRRRARACAPRLGRRARLLDTRRLRAPDREPRGARTATARCYGCRRARGLVRPAVWTEEAVAALRARPPPQAAGRTGDDPFAPYCVSCVNTALAAAIGADTPTTNAATRAYCGSGSAASASAAPSARRSSSTSCAATASSACSRCSRPSLTTAATTCAAAAASCTSMSRYCSESRRAVGARTARRRAPRPLRRHARRLDPRASTRRPRAAPPPPPRRASTSARWAQTQRRRHRRPSIV